MLYPKNQEPRLSDELFSNPSSEYRGTPFWAWNCALKKEELLWQLEVMKKMGMGGAHMHVRTGLATPYLSDEHMELIKACVEKCREEKLLAWLYDEDRWPSGAAGGIVTRDKRFRSRHLLFTTKPYRKDADQKQAYDMSGRVSRSENGYLLACYDVVLDGNDCLESAARIAPEQDAVGTKWYVYVETPNENPWYNNQTYVNTLDKAAIARFIQVTYERYWETVGKDFGGVVPAIFTDEPQFARKETLGFAREEKDVVLPWSDDVPQTFMEAYGQDILDGLPQLLWELPDGQVSTVRYHYHDHICERFAQAFADQCGDWCDKHGLMLTGHMMLEPTLESQTCSMSEAMRSYRSFHLPGIDMLANRREFTTAKQAQSAARQYGREGVMSELYGVTGWDFDFRGHKYQGDWQAALGITVRVPHLAWVSMKGEAKRDYPASINYQSPWWKDYSFVEDHFARVNTAMTRGKAEVRVGVIHPVESYWLHFGPREQTQGIREQLDQNFQDLTKWLLCGSIDFDFISEALLPEQCSTGGAPLQVGQMAYDTIIVPGCETLRSSTLERLEAFHAAGGKLIFLGKPPKYQDAIPSDRGELLWKKATRTEFGKEPVLQALEAVRLVSIRNADGSRSANLIHQLRRDGADRWLFIAHSEMPYCRDVPRSQKLRIALEGEYGVIRYDTQTGACLPLPSTVENGKTVIRVELYDLDSLLLRYTDRAQVCPQPEMPMGDAVKLELPKRVRYSLDAPNMYLLDKAEFALNDAPYQPAQELLRADNVLRKQLGWPMRQGAVAQPWTIQEPKPEHRVRLRFTVHSTVDVENAKLALEDADVARILCNGRAVTAKPEGWYIDKSIGTVAIGALRAGENVIEVILPFGRRTNVEWCYLLGDFGVRVSGEFRQLVAAEPLLGFSDAVTQGLAHYCGNITYYLDVETAGGEVFVTVPHYAGAGVRVEVDGRKEYIVYPPYRKTLGRLPAGKHTVKLTLLGNCQNGFGPVHKADFNDHWIGPNAWRTGGYAWTESYRLESLGILSAPVIEEM